MLMTAPPPALSRTSELPAASSHREVRHPYLLTTSVHHPGRELSWPPHQHPEHELLWTDRGVVTMEAGGRRWTLTPGVGLWVPAGTTHTGSAHERSAVRTTYVSPESWPTGWDRPVTVRLDPAVRQLLLHLKSTPMSRENRLRAQRVCLDLLQLADPLRLDVPVPEDPRLAVLVQTVLRDPGDDRSLEQWAAVLNLTSRTLTRAFTAEIGMSFARWRRLVRMRTAAGQIADGTSVKVVARRVGYSSTSAFVAAYHKTLGHTPGVAAQRW